MTLKQLFFSYLNLILRNKFLNRKSYMQFINTIVTQLSIKGKLYIIEKYVTPTSNYEFIMAVFVLYNIVTNFK